MANIDSKLKIAELDFNGIRENLKAFLKDQSEFSDYNFEGSGMSVLLDLLSYNTHYMGYYMNMLANEMFIDTALTRPSVVSHAKLLGYTPRSRVGSRALINVTFQEVTGGSNSAVTIPRFTRFGSVPKDGVNYVFVTTENRVATKNNAGYFVFDNLEIKEGQPNSYTFIYDSSTNQKQIFELPDSGIDTSTLRVQVQESAQSIVLETFYLAEDATSVATDSKVFYLEENRNGKYQIYFGDDVVGKKLDDGNIIIVSYVITSGADANGIKTFKLIDEVLNGVTPTIVLSAESSSGQMEEGINSIKFTAPKSFIAQNRAVTKNDYIALINKRYPYYDSVSVWGGEEATPPVYGKIYFSLKPRGNYEITQSEIAYLKDNVIAPYSVLTVTPEYVSADYDYINLAVNVIYDPRKTTKTAGAIQSTVRNAIVSFADENLNTFNNTFKISRLIRAIDDSDPSIENNTVSVVIEKRFKPILGVPTSYRIDFYVPLKRGTALDRIIAEPTFQYYDEFGIIRNCSIEEQPQSFTGIDEIEILATGSGYTDLPDIIIDGDGVGAKAKAVIVNGKLKSVVITDPGYNYSSAVARVVGGNGTGAMIKPVLQGKKGTLRVYYYDSNNIKKIINDNVGTVYYEEGYIQLIDFSPITVADAYGTLTFKATPKVGVFSTTRNAILTLDSTDPSSIDIKVSPVVS